MLRKLSTKKGENLHSHVARFLDVTNCLSKTGITLSEKEQIKKQVDSSQQDWSLQCMMFNRDMLTSSSTSADLINTPKVFEKTGITLFYYNK
jgi:hypothetical protein